jgi:hypothetical protein
MSDGGSFYGLIHFRPWSDTSGGYPYQLAFTENHNLWFRKATSSTDWGSWQKIITSSNYSSTLDNRYYTESEADNRFVNVAGDTMTGGLTFSTDSAITWSRNTDFA